MKRLAPRLGPGTLRRTRLSGSADGRKPESRSVDDFDVDYQLQRELVFPVVTGGCRVDSQNLQRQDRWRKWNAGLKNIKQMMSMYKQQISSQYARSFGYA